MQDPIESDLAGLPIIIFLWQVFLFHFLDAIVQSPHSYGDKSIETSEVNPYLVLVSYARCSSAPPLFYSSPWQDLQRPTVSLAISKVPMVKPKMDSASGLQASGPTIRARSAAFRAANQLCDIGVEVGPVNIASSIEAAISAGLPTVDPAGSISMIWSQMNAGNDGGEPGTAEKLSLAPERTLNP